MGVIIPLKRFKWALFWLILAQHSFGVETQGQLPVIHNIGLIPVQLAKNQDDPELFQAIDHTKKAFSKVVRQSFRFRVLSDELVAKMWLTPSQREELHNEYELSAFIHLTMEFRDDQVNLIARLLSPKLEPYLQESRVVELQKFKFMNYDTIYEQLSQLTFSLINRLPVDVSVTSVQGRFITLSGGRNQGIQPNETIDLVRPHIRNIHPANHTWVSFENAPLGKAQIVDVSEYTSVARLVKLTYEGAVKVGDGALIKRIAARSKFRVESNLINKNNNSNELIIPLLTTDAKQPSEPKTSTDKTESKDQNFIPITKQDSDQKNQENKPDAPTPNNEQNITSEEVKPIYQEPIFSTGKDQWFQITLGYTGWSYQGPSKTGSQLVWYLPFNSLGIACGFPLTENIAYDIQGLISLGKTEKKGSYGLYIGEGSVYWHENQKLLGGLANKWKAGAKASFLGLGVKSELFGGADLIQGEVFGELLGNADIYEISTKLSLKPLTFGRIGYNNSQNTIRSSFGLRFDLMVFNQFRANKSQTGAGFFYDSTVLSDSRAKVIDLGRIGLQVIYRLN